MTAPAVPTVTIPDWPTIIAQAEAAGVAEYAFTQEQANVLRVALYRKGWQVKLRHVDGGYRLTLQGKRNSPTLA